jgi:hypothetical protein
MLTVKKPEPAIVSAHPMALATLTMQKNGVPILVEWTSVRKVRWKRSGYEYIRHVLEPILKEHLGGWKEGLGLDLREYDVGCRLVVDVAVDPRSNPASDMHVEG